MAESLEYTWDFSVCSFNIDKNYRMKLSSVMEYSQEAVHRIFKKNNVTYGENVMFILIRSMINIHRMPVIDEHITLKIKFEYGDLVMFYFRVWFLDENNNVLIELEKACGCMDKAERKFLKTSAIIPVSWKKYGVIEKKMRGLRMPKDMEHFDTHRVKPTEIDFNNHMNNTRYADLCINYMPENRRELKLKRFGIDYHAECLCDSDVYLYGTESKNTFFISGRNAGRKSFDAVMEFDI